MKTSKAISLQDANVNSLEEILNYEKNRYVRKGYGLFFAILFTFLWFIWLPSTAKHWWPRKIEEEGKFYSIYAFIIHEFFFLFANTVMWIIYKLEWNFFERYKVHDKQWPWKSNPEEWRKLISDTIIMLFVNHVIFLPLTIIPYYIKNESLVRLDFESLPSSFEIIWQTLFFMIAEDTTFYWAHRFLHLDFIYPYIHKIHHKYVNTVSISSEYAHPVEYIFGNVLTTNSGALILGKRVHGLTYFMWMVLRIAETTDGHCGYEFSWSPYRLLPMSGGSEYHNYHHLAFKGNYASFFTIWDRLCNTVHHKYIEFIAKKKDIYQKLELEEKLKRTKEAQKKQE